MSDVPSSPASETPPSDPGQLAPIYRPVSDLGGPAPQPQAPAAIDPVDAALAASNDPVQQFRVALDSAITAIEPYAVMGEGNRSGFVEPTSMLEQVSEMGQGRQVTAETERGEFSGLAQALSNFSASLNGITFPKKALESAAAVTAASEALRLVALGHAQPDDKASPSLDKQQSKLFLHAVNEWEGATAKLASKLGL